MNTPRKTLAGIAAILLLGATAPHTIAGTPSPATLPLCSGVYEDGSLLEPDDVGPTFPCLWDASVLGNRQGQSFIMWRAT